MWVKVRISAIFAATILIAAIWSQRQTLHEERAEVSWLQSINTSVGEPSPDTDTITEIERLRKETRELPKLRNEVRQLWMQTNAFNSLRRENERLLAEFAALTNAPPRPPPTPEHGFALNHTWANAGLGTPEACIQSFFWAAHHQNLEVLAACLDPEHARAAGFIKETGEWSEGLQYLLLLGKAQAYRIVQIEPRAEDRVTAHLQAAVDGATMRFSLTRIGAVWKMRFQ